MSARQNGDLNIKAPYIQDRLVFKIVARAGTPREQEPHASRDRTQPGAPREQEQRGRKHRDQLNECSPMRAQGLHPCSLTTCTLNPTAIKP